MIINLEEQIAEVRREIAMRERLYPHYVATKRTTKTKADHQLAVMRAVLRTLLDASGDSGDLFPVAPNFPDKILRDSIK
jgi:hypothetical protein